MHPYITLTAPQSQVSYPPPATNSLCKIGVDARRAQEEQQCLQALTAAGSPGYAPYPRSCRTSGEKLPSGTASSYYHLLFPTLPNHSTCEHCGVIALSSFSSCSSSQQCPLRPPRCAGTGALHDVPDVATGSSWGHEPPWRSACYPHITHFLGT